MTTAGGAKRFTVRRSQMRETERVALRDFWEQQYGPFGAFYYDAPNADGNGTTRYGCRFENEPLSWEMVSDFVCSVGVTLVEIPDSSPSYTLNAAVFRFPSSELSAALLSQVQQLIPLVKIQPLEAGYATRRISRTCWKQFDDGLGCPYSQQGGLDVTHFPGASPFSCDKGTKRRTGAWRTA